MDKILFKKNLIINFFKSLLSFIDISDKFAEYLQISMIWNAVHLALSVSGGANDVRRGSEPSSFLVACVVTNHFSYSHLAAIGSGWSCSVMLSTWDQRGRKAGLTLELERDLAVFENVALSRETLKVAWRSAQQFCIVWHFKPFMKLIFSST